ncbi:MAG: V-type ATP synthase subunit I [Candidatus Cryptobacteroides sp.]
MTKYSFILLTEGQETFLKELQELGVVDITRSSKPVDDRSASLLSKAGECKSALSKLNRADWSKDPDFAAIQKSAEGMDFSSSGAGDIVQLTDSAFSELAELTAQIQSARKELIYRESWGDFDKSAIDRLEEIGYKFHFYNISAKTFSSIDRSGWAVQVISEDEKSVRFVVVAPTDEEYTFPAQECPAPEGNWKETAAEIERLNGEIIERKARILKLKECTGILADSLNDGLVNLDRYLAVSAGEKAAENMVTTFTGFAPVEEEERLCKAFDGMEVYYLKEEAKEEDNPPIKLRNNKFASMFEVLTGMYGMPVYGEFDLTPVLAPFFMLFFALCMGDAGYGIILMLFGTALCRKWISIDMFKGLGPLIATLGAATFVVGIFLGTFFGVNLSEAAWVPEWLKSVMIVGYIAGFPAQMVLAVGIGVFHVCLAMVIKAIGYTKRFGLKANISTWGWVLLIVGGLILAGLGFLEVMDTAVMKVIVTVLGIVSALAIYVFNTPGRNPLMNIGSGLWDTYNMATGLLGDILSYIRLYALGLAGGMLGYAFNILGGLVLGDGGILNWPFFIILVVFGHVLNMAMACLGAFVHPLRLTFVEFFKNSGYEGRGKAYKPLKTEAEQ